MPALGRGEQGAEAVAISCLIRDHLAWRLPPGQAIKGARQALDQVSCHPSWRPGAPDLVRAQGLCCAPKDQPAMQQPGLHFCLLLLCHELQGLQLPATPGGATATVKPPGMEVAPLPVSPGAPSSHRSAARVLLDSLPGRLPQAGLPRVGVSCQDLLPEALEGFSQLPLLPQTLIIAALALSLQGAGCPRQAEGLVLRLYGVVGVDDANMLLLGIAGLPGTPRRGGTPLLFNGGQLAGAGPRHCLGLARLDSSLLLGPVTSTHGAFPAAAMACHRLGSACAGVTSNGTTSFSVIGQPGAYSRPGRGAQAWLHRCRWAGRNRRRSPEACSSKREQKVHGMLEWVPLVSTYYNVGTSIYYAFQNCTELAKERGLEAALDLSYDVLLGLVGGAGGSLGFGVGMGLKPAIKVGVRSLISYFRQVEPSAALPTSSSSPVTAADSFVPPSVWV
ncbi:apolipoprotein F isoform X2 [Dermochelys coriacea]|uniref:apolipoprotein F isoform X2 n=1 Tax=Dermochelys coriacea TaxID=27794 RepID=UPI0018E8EA44|nr:apolipoprotein F isoform X2 [Dermochelys coriacea]